MKEVMFSCCYSSPGLAGNLEVLTTIDRSILGWTYLWWCDPSEVGLCNSLGRVGAVRAMLDQSNTWRESSSQWMGTRVGSVEESSTRSI